MTKSKIIDRLVEIIASNVPINWNSGEMKLEQHEIRRISEKLAEELRRDKLIKYNH